MQKSKKTYSGIGLALLLLLLVSPVGLIIAVFAGVAGVIGVIWWSKHSINNPSHVTSKINNQSYYLLGEIEHAYNLLYKKFNRPGAWRTKLKRIDEARSLERRIISYENANLGFKELAESHKHSLQDWIQSMSIEIIPDINKFFSCQLNKFKSKTPSHERILAMSTDLMNLLEEISRLSMELEKTARPWRQLVLDTIKTAEYNSTYQERSREAAKFEKSGQYKDAISIYINTLYMLKTDNIADEEQENEIADLEENIRRATRSFATRLKGKNGRNLRS